MASGKYREKITIEKKAASPGRDDFGRPTNEAADWAEHHKPFAWGASRGSSEFEKSGVITAECSNVFRCRYSSETNGITAEMRLTRSDGTVLNIIGAYPVDSTRREIQIEAKTES